MEQWGARTEDERPGGRRTADGNAGRRQTVEIKEDREKEGENQIRKTGDNRRPEER